MDKLIENTNIYWHPIWRKHTTKASTLNSQSPKINKGKHYSTLKMMKEVSNANPILTN